MILEKVPGVTGPAFNTVILPTVLVREVVWHYGATSVPHRAVTCQEMAVFVYKTSPFDTVALIETACIYVM